MANPAGSRSRNKGRQGFWVPPALDSGNRICIFDVLQLFPDDKRKLEKMLAPPDTPNEAQRLAILRKLNILDTPPEEGFARIARIGQSLLAETEFEDVIHLKNGEVKRGVIISQVPNEASQQRIGPKGFTRQEPMPSCQNNLENGF